MTDFPSSPVSASATPIALIDRRLEDLAEANAIYGKDQHLNTPYKIARNEREISWLRDLRSELVLSGHAQCPPAPDQAWRDSDWLGLSASERACYHWPEDTDLHRQCRAAYLAGATDYAMPATPSRGQVMNLAELANETLTQKHRRLMQEKCPHEGIYSSTVASNDGAFTNSFCLDCGKSWHSAHTRPLCGGKDE